MGCVASRPESVELVPEAGIGPGAGTRVGATEEHDIVGIILLVNVPRETPIEDRERCGVPRPPTSCDFSRRGTPEVPTFSLGLLFHAELVFDGPGAG